MDSGRSSEPKTSLTIRGVSTAVIEAPMRFPLGTSAATVRAAPLLLVDLATEQGITGRTYLFCYRTSAAKGVAALLEDAVELVRGQRVAPVEIGQLLGRRFALLSVTGIARMALAALDGALWDALAQAAGLPLATMLGGSVRKIPAYNSSGLGLMAPEAAADEAELLLERGFKAVKLRLGHPSLKQDMAVTRAVRARCPDAIEIFVDYNQALDVPEALKRGLALEGEGVAWLEEPIRHDDLAGCAALARDLKLPVQLGENFDGPNQMVAGAARRRVRPGDAGLCTDRRRHRLDPGRRDRGRRGHSDVVASAARGQRASAGGDADRALAGICRLGRYVPRTAARDQ